MSLTSLDGRMLEKIATSW